MPFVRDLNRVARIGRLLVGMAILISHVSHRCHAQLTCATAQEVFLGTVPFATASSFGNHLPPSSSTCGGGTIYRSAYFRFVAPSTGWYSVCAIIPTDPNQLWSPRISVAAGCGGPEDRASFRAGSYFSDAGVACVGALRTYVTSVFRMEAGESRIIVVGGETANDFGQGSLRLDYVGSTQFAGAQPLQLGANTFQVPGFGRPLRSGACDIMPNAQRFSFTPPQSGTYRVSFCDGLLPYWRISADPDLQTTLAGTVHCNNGFEFTGDLEAGTTYYIAPGSQWNSSACSTRRTVVTLIVPCPPDLNDDAWVDGMDLGLLLAAWGTPEADLTGDGVTDGADLSLVLALWGPCPE